MKSRFEKLAPVEAKIARVDNVRERTESTAQALLGKYDQGSNRLQETWRPAELLEQSMALADDVETLVKEGFYDSPPDGIHKALVLEALKVARKVFNQSSSEVHDDLLQANLIRKATGNWPKVSGGGTYQYHTKHKGLEAGGIKIKYEKIVDESIAKLEQVQED